jgi:orotate phosphoribosyltransferase
MAVSSPARGGGAIKEIEAMDQAAKMADCTRAKRRLLEILKAKSIFKGTFTLASGVESNYYVDVRKTTFDPEGAALIAEIICGLIAEDRDVDAIGGLELGSVPIVASVCARSWPDRPVNGFVVRKARKDHGTGNRIDGNFTPKSTVVLIEDVTTTGGSVMQAVRAVREQGGTIKKIISVVDRLEGASENLKREGLDLVAIFTMQDFAD